MNLSEQALKERLAGRDFGAEVHYFHEIDSTNVMACRLARKGAPEGTVVVADAQARGKGRLNRAWHSPPGANLYVSIILRPRIAPAVAPQTTLVAGVAVAELLVRYHPEGVTIKWPNDVLIGGRKICGILTEMQAAAAGVEFIVLGIGLNVNMNHDDFDPDLRAIATSLRIETGKYFKRLDVLSELLRLLETWYMIFLNLGFPGVRETWLRYADLVGRKIQVVFREDKQTGVVMGIDNAGTILMKDGSGRIQRVIAGDIHFVKE